MSEKLREFLTLREAAAELKISYSTIHAMTKSGELPTWRPPGHRRIVRIRRSDLSRLFSGNEVTK